MPNEFYKARVWRLPEDSLYLDLQVAHNEDNLIQLGSLRVQDLQRTMG